MGCMQVFLSDKSSDQLQLEKFKNLNETSQKFVGTLKSRSLFHDKWKTLCNETSDEVDEPPCKTARHETSIAHEPMQDVESNDVHVHPSDMEVPVERQDTSNLERQLSHGATIPELQRHLVAEYMKVPIGCLREPAASRCFRQIDENHVKELKQEIRTRSASKFTSIVCHIPSTFRTSVDLQKVEKGAYELEVLGGNHTRVAVQELQQEMPNNEVFGYWPVTLYCGLSPVQALKIGYDHNRTHLFGKTPTFHEIVQLFRKQLLQTHDTYTELVDISERQINISWKRSLTSIMGCKNPQDLNNRYKTHVAAAMLPKEVWVLLEEVFKLWHERKLRKQTLGAMKRTLLKHFCRIPSMESKKELLVNLASGVLTVPEFKTACIQLVPPKKDNSKEREDPGNPETLQEEETEEETTCTHQEISNSIPEPGAKEIHGNSSSILSQKLQDLQKSNEELQKKVEELVNEKKRLQKESEENASQLQSDRDKYKSLAETLKLQMKTSQNEIARLKGQVRSLTDAQEFLTKQVEQRDEDLHSYIMQAKETNQGQTDPVATDVKSQKKKLTFVLVEYNNAAVYLSTLSSDNSKVTYCRKPLGHIRGNPAELVLQTSNLPKSLQINTKDVQDVDEKYIIACLPEAQGSLERDMFIPHDQDSFLAASMGKVQEYLAKKDR